MKTRTSNQLKMVEACLAVAQGPEHIAVWTDQEPVAFGTYLRQLQESYSSVLSTVALTESAAGGAADTKAATESILEEQAHVFARALAFHFKKAKDLTRRAQVDLSRSAIEQLREKELISKTTNIRDLGAAAVSEPDAAAHGITSARVDALTAAIGAFQKAMVLPRGQIVNRGTLLKEIETDTAALIEQLHDLDDLVVQFEITPAGKRFVEAWTRARVIIDRVAEFSVKTPATDKTPQPAGAN